MAVSESTAQRYLQSDPDVRLMIQVRDDDADAFEELVLRYQSRLLMVLQHMVGSREHAEDLTQEVFLRVYRARKRYEPGAKFATWLFTIAHNVAANAIRSLSRRKEVNVDGGANQSAVQPLDRMALAASGLMPTRHLDKAERAEIVRLAVESLNERQRMALLLSKFEGMSYADIAEAMDLTTQAIKSLLSRARGNLREFLEPYMTEGTLPEEAT